MIRLRRKNTAWLTVLGAVIAFALLAGGVAITPPVQLALIAVFAVAMIASMVEVGQDRETIMDALRRAPLRNRVSPHAREATERARTLGGYVNNDLMLMDLGLIALQSSYEGMAMRRTRSISKDDDGVRPFLTLYVDPTEADRHAVIRYEIYNQYGEQQYIHEMKTFLRDGEMNILADHHLPLAGNMDVEGSGDWDLRLYIDGNLVGVHNFMLAPSMNERANRLASRHDNGSRDVQFDIIDEVEQEVPPRLQDLLQNDSKPASRLQQRQRSSRSDSSQSDSSGNPRRVRTTSRRR